MDPVEALLIVDGDIEATEEQSIEAWRYLADAGLLGTLPGRYGRTYQVLADAGLL